LNHRGVGKATLTAKSVAAVGFDGSGSTTRHVDTLGMADFLEQRWRSKVGLADNT
jgi:hypothetical protein